MAFMQLHIHSQLLGMDEDVWAFLPEPSSIGEGKTRVLWFLHGGSGDHQAGAHIVGVHDIALTRNIAIIMPNVHRSCYVDMNMGPKYAAYMGQELPVLLRAMFPFLSDRREDNWVSGFSNGGYGTFHLALSYPGLYGWGGAFAAGDKADANWEGRMLDKHVFFGHGDLTKTDASIRHQARTLYENGGPFPGFFHACGEKDPWFEMNQLVRKEFESLPGNPFNYTYFQVPERGHDTLCWQIALNRFLDHIGVRKEAF